MIERNSAKKFVEKVYWEASDKYLTDMNINSGNRLSVVADMYRVVGGESDEMLITFENIKVYFNGREVDYFTEELTEDALEDMYNKC